MSEAETISNDAGRPVQRLSDAQVQEFICNGFIRLNPDIAPARHTEIEATIRHAFDHEFRMGNNILARVPSMYEVLECPVVVGAIASLLGDNYLLHPHRAVHSSTPVEDKTIVPSIDAQAPQMGKGSMAGSGWHQDAQSPLARARHHLPRYLIMFYFPHDTPGEMGPTRIDAGSHLYSQMRLPTHATMPDFVPAGTVFLMHFDLGHAAYPNRTELTRYMVKFVFTRTEVPTGPGWRNESVAWQTPETCIPAGELVRTWSAVWHWMRGSRQLLPASRSIPDLMRALAGTQAERLEAIYELAAQDGAAPDLLAQVLRSAGQLRSSRNLAVDKSGAPVPRDDITPEPRWNERAIVMEDGAYALAAMGRAAVPAALVLLRHEDPWMNINGAWIVGELGLADNSLVEGLAGLLLHHDQHVVRQAVDALGALGCEINHLLPVLVALLRNTRPGWDTAEVQRGWTGHDQIRLNVLFALVSLLNRAGTDTDAVAAILASVLDDSNGYVPAIACEGLGRIGSREALEAAYAHLRRRRWDETLRGGEKLY